METKNILSSEDREFFELVSRAAFSNPFSDDRVELDLKIAGCSPRASDEERVHRVVAAVRQHIDRLAVEGKADLNRFSAEDRFMMQSSFLFEVFHHFIPQLDRMILEQVRSGETTCSVPFARDALEMLARRGFSRADSERFFGMFYQVRRAFHFIVNGLIGESPSMKQLRRHLWTNVFTHDIRWYERYLWNRMEDFSTLLLGETGTGKGTAAAAIGRAGFIPFDPGKGCFTESFARNFIAINLSQYSESLIESELFGHRKGAFTGAIEHHQGIFSRCSPHGAIFLDEIGDVSMPVQVKLLQVLQERTFSPVGSHEKLRFNGRVMAATNKPLDRLRREGQFRDDFFYRLCSDIIVVPSLRRRLEEDPRELDAMLAHVVLRMLGESAPDLVRMVREVIERDVGPHYPWPGNVRELEQAVRRILLTNHYVGHLDTTARDEGPRELAASMEAGGLDAQGLLSAYCAMLHERFGTYEEVARRTRLDRRTVKRYVERARKA
jgi:DNA-binding NtrC family response regulator